MHTGSPRLGRPSIGSWVTYGLGSESNDLPGFIVLTSGGTPDGGKSLGVMGFYLLFIKVFNVDQKGDPVLYLKNPKGVSQELKKNIIGSINQINYNEYKKFNDPEVLTRISQYEMAFRMQSSVPEVMNINDEPKYIKRCMAFNLEKNPLQTIAY